LTPNDNPFYRQIAAFAAAIRGEAPVAVPPEDARRAIAVAAAARDSLRTGQAILV
ncbi:MAG: gfo/Idh/MocA family oxidoreductase, partial [Cytophagales bacterium]|nr:gfo/Idh/MocA family oxidoreductase [Armatimonadota bacterium]